LIQLRQELAEKETELDGLNGIYEKLSSDKIQMEEKIANSHRILNDRSLILFQCKEQSFELASKISQSKNELAKVESQKDQLLNRKNRQVKTSKIRRRARRHPYGRKNVNLQFDQLKTEAGEKQRSLEELVQSKERLFENLKNIQDELAKEKENKSESQHRLELLYKLDGPGFQSIREIMERKRLSGEESKNILALLDLLEIEDGYEIATAAALSDFSNLWL